MVIYYALQASYAGVAQLAEQLICNQQVVGSTPITSSNYGSVPEWPKGTDCKSAVSDFGGPNPPAPTRKPDAQASGFQLSVPPRRNVKRPSDVKCASRVKCAFGTIPAEHLTSLAAKRHTSLCFTCPQGKLHRKETVMSESKLHNQSLDFAVRIINLIKDLKSKHETIISNQIGHSGTSIGANIREAQYAHGKPDFISKLQIALKEANETGYWLELLYKTDNIDEQTYKSLDSACASIRVMLISSINTSKENERG